MRDEHPWRISPEQRELLERIARGEELHAFLARIVGLIESVTVGATCSILLLDRDGVHIRHGAAPGLPRSFVRAIDGLPIGPNEGSCGAAAFRGERVIAEDIATHPNWAPYRDVALAAGLRACWSSPIFSTRGKVLGTFALYYAVPHAPEPAEVEAVDIATHLAALAIERARADEDLRRSELRYRRIFESVVDAVYEVAIDAEGEFRFSAVNEAFLTATGLAADQVVGKRVKDVIPPESVALVLRSYHTAIEERRSVSWEEVSLYPAGTRYGDVSVSPIFEDGRCTGLVGTVHDTTARREAQARIAAQDVLIRRGQRMRSLAEMCGGIAHDFNNLLGGLMGHVALVRMAAEGNTEVEVSLEHVERAAERASELARRLVAFARGRETPPRLLALRDPVEEAVGLLRPTTGSRITLDLVVDGALPGVVADATAIHQVVVNLVTNAVRAIGADRGRILVALRAVAVDAPRPVTTIGPLKPGQYVELSVADDGPGMAPDTVARAFEPYYTTDETRGTGLGMWVVRTVVAQHLGAIDVQSALGAGTTIRVFLPAVAELDPG